MSAFGIVHQLGAIAQLDGRLRILLGRADVVGIEEWASLPVFTYGGIRFRTIPAGSAVSSKKVHGVLCVLCVFFLFQGCVRPFPVATPIL